MENIEQVKVPEYKDVEEQEYQNQIDAIGDRYQMIKDLLFKDGGYPQALMYINALTDGGHLKMEDLLQSFGRSYDNMKYTLENNSIVSASRFVISLAKQKDKIGHPFGCLDKDLKFCVKIFGKDDWSDVLYVFPYMNGNKAYDVSFKYDV